MENAIVEQNAQQISPFSTKQSFTDAWQMADCLSRSSVVPVQYQGKDNIPNCIIALELAHRLSISPFLVMQNTYVIQGRPSWSSQYLIGSINISGKFSPLRWKMIKKGGKIKADYKVADGWDSVNKKKKYKTMTVEVENIGCIAYATELATGEILEGPEINISMAIAEGWYGKEGSKWQTMPELMLRYRSAAFFCRMYCPEVAMGLHTTEEIEDIEFDPTPVIKTAKARAEDLTEKLMNEQPEDDSSVVETVFTPSESEHGKPKSVTEQPKTVIEEPAPVREKAKAAPVQQKQEEQQQTFEDDDFPPEEAFTPPSDDGSMLF